MNERFIYTYSPFVWPLAAATGLQALLVCYAWQRRQVPGAAALAIVFFSTCLWGGGALLELSGVDAATKIFWIKFQALWPLPAATAVMCFILQYTGYGRWLTRRRRLLLSLPPLLLVLLAITNDLHHWMWREFVFDGGLREIRGSAYGLVLAYALALALVSLGALIRLFVSTPERRWPAALLIGCVIAVRGAYMMDVTKAYLFWPSDFIMLILSVTSAVYTIIVFHFHAVDPVPVARAVVTEQMREGMLVLNNQDTILDVNPMAQIILGRPADAVKGHALGEFIPALTHLKPSEIDDTSIHVEICLEGRSTPRHYTLSRSPLSDRRGRAAGSLILLTDITAEKRAQAALQQEQRATIVLQERQHLARELHDSLGQVLGYVSMQAQAIRKYALDGDLTTTETQLNRLALVAQAAHDDLRVSILGLLTDSAQGWSFFTALQQLLDAYRDRYGIQTRLTLPAGLCDDELEADAAIQLIRVIQEALTNASAHGQARCVQLTFERLSGQMRVVIADDGLGFDPEQRPPVGVHHFGLSSMRSRMEQIGGAFAIHSRPGNGAQVVLVVPLRPAPEEGS